MTPQLIPALQTCVGLKQAQPDLTIVLGGAHIDSTHEDVFSMADCFDFAIYGEGEYALLGVCAAAAAARFRQSGRSSRGRRQRHLSRQRRPGDPQPLAPVSREPRRSALCRLRHGRYSEVRHSDHGGQVRHLDDAVAGLPVQMHLLRRADHHGQETSFLDHGSDHSRHQALRREVRLPQLRLQGQHVHGEQEMGGCVLRSR